MSPTAEMPVANRLDRVEIKPPAPGAARRILSAVAIFDGEHWSALCPQLDIAAEGDTVGEAFENLRAAIRESIEVAAERGLSPGEPTPDSDVLAFMQTHRSVEPVRGEQFFV
jgi:predicted RNase H-like HicB family nuclease